MILQGIPGLSDCNGLNVNYSRTILATNVGITENLIKAKLWTVLKRLGLPSEDEFELKQHEHEHEHMKYYCN